MTSIMVWKSKSDRSWETRGGYHILHTTRMRNPYTLRFKGSVANLNPDVFNEAGQARYPSLADAQDAAERDLALRMGVSKYHSLADRPPMLSDIELLVCSAATPVIRWKPAFGRSTDITLGWHPGSNTRCEHSGEFMPFVGYPAVSPRVAERMADAPAPALADLQAKIQALGEELAKLQREVSARPLSATESAETAPAGGESANSPAAVSAGQEDFRVGAAVSVLNKNGQHRRLGYVDVVSGDCYRVNVVPLAGFPDSGYAAWFMFDELMFTNAATS